MSTSKSYSLYDGDTFELISKGVSLDEMFPNDDDADEKAKVAEEIEKRGEYWVGGGAAALFVIRN